MMQADFVFTYHPLQRKRFQEGQLVREWRDRYPDLFDAKDEAVTKTQPTNHFYEWLTAVLLRESLGYNSIVEQYIAKSHPEKRAKFKAIVPPDVFEFVDENQSGLPDLFVFDPTSSKDWFFCEVKGGRDRVQPNQEVLMPTLAKKCGGRVRLIKLNELRC